jgi:hypothetical protein
MILMESRRTEGRNIEGSISAFARTPPNEERQRDTRDPVRLSVARRVNEMLSACIGRNRNRFACKRAAQRQVRPERVVADADRPAHEILRSAATPWPNRRYSAAVRCVRPAQT